jgi:hypothetical protein
MSNNGNNKDELTPRAKLIVSIALTVIFVPPLVIGLLKLNLWLWSLCGF